MPTESNGLKSPAEQPLVSPSNELAPGTTDKNSDKVQMKKQLGLIEGIAVILGVIFGSGKYYYSFIKYEIYYTDLYHFLVN